MGTRADFYVGRGPTADWLGSTAWDGYPEGIPDTITAAFDERTYRAVVTEFITGRDDGTLPEMGWPWPWDDSNTTDYAYAFEGDEVWASRFGRPWFKIADGEPEEDEDAPYVRQYQDHPNMADRKPERTPMGKRSGLMVIGPNGIVEDDE